MNKSVKVPGPDHPITVEPTRGRVVVKASGKIVADTRSALTLQEATYPAVQYIPRGDVDMAQLTRTTHTTYCPYKATLHIIASRVRKTRCGATRLRIPPWARSRTILLSIQTASMPSK